jgi:hypothetical protein
MPAQDQSAASAWPSPGAAQHRFRSQAHANFTFLFVRKIAAGGAFLET